MRKKKMKKNCKTEFFENDILNICKTKSLELTKMYLLFIMKIEFFCGDVGK